MLDERRAAITMWSHNRVCLCANITIARRRSRYYYYYFIDQIYLILSFLIISTYSFRLQTIQKYHFLISTRMC
jgi:hypothetical protein